MTRRVATAVLLIGIINVSTASAAAWWPFGKKDGAAQDQAGVRTAANHPVKPTPTTTPQKSSWWNPFAPKPKPANTFASPYSGVGSSYNTRKPPEKEKKGFFGSLFGSEQQPEKLHTIDDFMRLERPTP